MIRTPYFSTGIIDVTFNTKYQAVTDSANIAIANGWEAPSPATLLNLILDVLSALFSTISHFKRRICFVYIWNNINYQVFMKFSTIIYNILHKQMS